jgi:hypothetical protein
VSAGEKNEKNRDDDGPRLPWYQRPWLSSSDGFNWSPTSWGGLVALLVVIVVGVTVANWIGSLG